jgi:membrane protease YdiL (CAAX protease family)
MSASRVWTLLGATILLVSCLLVLAVQVVLLERSELEHESAWRSLQDLEGAPGSTRISARLTEVKLMNGDDAVFELCAQDAMEPAKFTGAFDVVVWQPKSQQLELKVPLDQAHLALVKRGSRRSCLTLGGGRVKAEATYALDLVWAGKPALTDALRAIPLKARVLARAPLTLREGLLVLGAALGALLAVLSGFSPSAAGVQPQAGKVGGLSRRGLWAVVGSLLAGLAAYAVLRLPFPGSIGGLARGLTLSLVQVGIAVGFAFLLYRKPRAGLGLYAPDRRSGAWLFASIGLALLLRPLALFAMRVIPATGEAPIEAFISWPSGALAFAGLGMAVPLAEELFFRGFVYGALAPRGRLLAVVVSTLLFASVHAQQTWGNWGALLAVTLTGLCLTCLRALSGSTLVPAVAHLLYNLTLWTDSFRG